jgi:hypothetical protein
MRMRKLVIGAVAVLCMAGCTSGPDETPEADPTQDVVQKIDPAKATAMKLGEDLEVVAKLPRKLGEQDVYFRGFTPDGKLVGSVSLPEKPANDGMVGGGLTSQSSAVLYDPGTKKFTILDSRKRERNTQLPSIVSSGDFVVWVETPDTTIGSSTIAIYSYDRRSKRVAQLYSADDPGGIMNWGSDLVVTGDKVYFSMFACCRKRDRGNAAVYSVPIDGLAPAKVLVKGGQFVTLTGDSLRYQVKEKGFSRDLATGETKPMPVSPRAKDPGFCGAEITESFETLCMGEPGGDEPGEVVHPMLTITETSGRATRFMPFPSDSLNYPVPHGVSSIGPWVGVTMTDDDGADREFLVDLESRAVKAFPKGRSFGPLNQDKTQALLTIRGTGKTSSQVIVQIPPLS